MNKQIDPSAEPLAEMSEIDDEWLRRRPGRGHHVARSCGAALLMGGLILFAAIAGCSARKDLGPISADGEAALKEWCPALEVTTRTAQENIDSRFPTVKGKSTLVFSCPGPKDKNWRGREEGDVIIDANTRRLLLLYIYVSPTSFDLIANRVLRSALDGDGQTALRELRQALDNAPKGTIKDWRQGGIYVVGDVANTEVPIWSIGVGPDQSQ